MFVCFFSQTFGCECFKITPGFAREALKAHNHYRELHQAKPLKLESNISAIAQKIANGMLSNSSSLKHSNRTYWNKKLGENLAMWSVGMSNTSGKWKRHYLEGDLQDRLLFVNI